MPIIIGDKFIYTCTVNNSLAVHLVEIPNSIIFGCKAAEDLYGSFIIPEGFEVDSVVIHQRSEKSEHLITDIEYKVFTEDDLSEYVVFKIDAGTEYIGCADYPVDVVLVKKNIE